MLQMARIIKMDRKSRPSDLAHGSPICERCTDSYTWFIGDGLARLLPT